jgi:adenylate cyclase
VGSEATERRLAAILAADVAGYSRLMGADEAGTLAALKRHRAEAIDPALAAHRGRIVKTTGDGLLAEFASVVDAVQCAVAMQAALARCNAALAADRRMQWRIGVNLGDVMVDAGDLFGDGVNVAARLEAIAEPGGVCLSQAAYEQVRDRLRLAFEDLGERALKNIARPVRAWRLFPAGDAPREAAPVAAAAPAATARKSIAVLPFNNMSGDADQEYFADGISEDIITDLSKLSGLFVIARNSSFTYKGRAVNVAQVARELGVGHVLEGSVRRAASRVRVTAQLIDGETGGHLWAERYDRDLTDIFAVQDELTRHIVSALAVRLSGDERRRLRHRGTDNLEAYELYLKGRDAVWRHTRDGALAAVPCLERAIALDGAFAAAHGALAMVHNLIYLNAWDDAPERHQETALALARRAVELDGDDPMAHFVLGVVQCWRREIDIAVDEAGRAIALEPSYAEAHALLGVSLHYAGRSAEGLESIREAMRLDPHYPVACLHFLGQGLYAIGDYEAAAEALKQRIERSADTDASRVLLAACYGRLGRAEEGRAAWRDALRFNPAYSLAQRRRVLPYKNPADFDAVIEGLRLAGIAVDS